MVNKYAVIDLGSNTFHLLITDDSLNVILRDRIFVSLAESGIDHITDGAIKRGKIALEKYMAQLSLHEVVDLKIVGTSALRSASNASEVISIFNNILGKDIEIIDGKREAFLIYKGILSLMGPNKNTGTHLLMDIGGGSTEFSVIHNGELLLSESKDIGSGVLYNKFHKHEPISDDDIQQLNHYLDIQVASITSLLENHPLDSIIGSSGTYETFQNLSDKTVPDDQLFKIEVNKIVEYMQSIVLLNYNQRIALEGISSSRAKLIVVGYLLVMYFTERFSPDHIYTSPYGIKEGLLNEMIRKDH